MLRQHRQVLSGWKIHVQRPGLRRQSPRWTICLLSQTALQWRMSKDPFVREKFTREWTAARKLAAEYFERFPKDVYRTEVESWRHLQSQNIEFTLKRLREPIEGTG